jgi:hypothetical protein
LHSPSAGAKWRHRTEVLAMTPTMDAWTAGLVTGLAVGGCVVLLLLFLAALGRGEREAQERFDVEEGQRAAYVGSWRRELHLHRHRHRRHRHRPPDAPGTSDGIRPGPV